MIYLCILTSSNIHTSQNEAEVFSYEGLYIVLGFVEYLIFFYYYFRPVGEEKGRKIENNGAASLQLVSFMFL